VEAASQFHFGHSVREITPAEAVMLVIQLANWNEYSPRKNPVKARKMQETILADMVDLGYIQKEDANSSFEDYWRKFDITLQSGSAFVLRKDPAPYFTMYVQQKLDEMIFGNMNVYQDGLEIYTTLNLDFQIQADAIMKERLDKVNKDYSKELNTKATDAESLYLPAVDLLSLNFNMPHMHVDKRRHMLDTVDTYAEEINPTLDIAASMFGLANAKEVAKQSYQWQLVRSKKTSVQGALVCIDPYTGYIYAMVGGHEFNTENQINYAAQAFVHPGSAFKPLFYSAALEEKKISPSTILKDVQTAYQEASGKVWIPNNYGDEYAGDVAARDAISHSLNIPAINVLKTIGFDSAISMASKLLGVNDPNEVQRDFPRSWSLALGVVNTSPLSMARAFSAFPNGGKGIEPIAILYVKDRNGKIIVEPEKERIAKIQYGGGLPQLMKPQTAYLMLDMLRGTVKSGTLTLAKESLGDIKYPLAGKTGTTQNWHDAWTMGFSPYFVTAVWFGFNKGGGSLGTNRTGALLAGPTWGKFMNLIHKQFDDDREQMNLAKKQLEKDDQQNGVSKDITSEDISKETGIPSVWLDVIKEEHDFTRPPGLVDFAVCSLSGLKPSPFCSRKVIRKEIFYPENVPEKECTICETKWKNDQERGRNIQLNVELENDIPKPTNLRDPRTIPNNLEDWEKVKNSILKKDQPDATTTKQKKDDQKQSNPYLSDN
jgi:penicillin-binding protein 1A